MTRRYRVVPMVMQRDGETLWAGALPSGPVIALGGTAELLLGILGEHEEPMDMQELLAQLREELLDLPADAEQVIAAFLEDLEGMGLVEAASPA